MQQLRKNGVGRRIRVGLAFVALMTAVLISAVSLASTGRADPDTDFADHLHTQGIYGPKDYNAWIGKITCKRLRNGVDADALASARFVEHNLPKGTDTGQVWQFVVAAINTYCPDQLPAVLDVAETEPS